MTPTLEQIAANGGIFLAALIQTAAGIGSGMVAVPILGLISLDYLPGPVLMANTMLSVVVLARTWRAAEPTEAPPLGLGLVAGTVAGTALLAAVPQDRLGLLFGVVILAAVGLSVSGAHLRLSPRRLLIGGFAGGVTGAAAAMHGPPLVLLYQREPTEKIRATMAAVFIFGCVLALVSLSLAGLLGWHEIRLGFGLVPGIVLGFFAGRAIGRRLSADVARGLMLAIAGLGGAGLILRAL